MDDVYDLFQRGTRLLEDGDFNQATVPLRKAAASSRTRPRSARRSAAPLPLAPLEEAAAEFEAVVERAPTNDYALFCLGRSLHAAAATPRRASRSRSPPACARTARDYREYRDRARGRAQRPRPAG